MELQQVMSKRDEQQMLDPNMYAPQEVAPLAQQKGIGEQFGDMAKQKAMESALTAGTSGLTAAGTSALGGSAMAGIGTAMPYVGAGMLAGKALGLFNAGGQVGPLSAQYHAEGTGAMKTPEMESLLEELAYKDYIEAFSDRLGAYQTGTLDSGKYSAGGPISPQYKAQGGNTMSREQAMSLMNNQPDPMANPMPQPRPINFPDPEELLQEMSMTEGAIGTPQVMPAPLSRPVDPMQNYKLEGRDRTYNPYDMLRPDNAPNT